jgi:hypothetical protein
MLQPLWRCPACGRGFANSNQPHACATWPLERHFAGRSEEVRLIFAAFREMLETLGPVTTIAEKTRIAFQARMSFAQLTLRRRWALGHFVLARRVEDPVFRKVESLSPRNHVHHFRLDSPDEVQALSDFAREAYGVGMQEHLQ